MVGQATKYLTVACVTNFTRLIFDVLSGLHCERKRKLLFTWDAETQEKICPTTLKETK